MIKQAHWDCTYVAVRNVLLWFELILWDGLRLVLPGETRVLSSIREAQMKYP